MTHYYNLGEQARYWHKLEAGQQMVIVLPLPEQPPLGYYQYRNLCEPINESSVTFHSQEGKFIWIKLPYPHNARIGMREAYAEGRYFHGEGKGTRWWYKADFIEETKKFPCNTPWRSSQSMPVLGIRSLSKVIGTRACRVQEADRIPEDMVKAGFRNRDEVINWFNARFSTPRPRRKDGKIDHYECWAWDDLDLEAAYFEDEYSSTGWIHQKKPLIIHVNPFVAVTKIEKEN